MMDAPRQRSVEEKMNRSLQVLRERSAQGKDVSKLFDYRKNLKNSPDAQNAKKTYKVKVTYVSKVDAISKEEAVAIAKAQVNKGTRTAWNTVENATVV